MASKKTTAIAAVVALGLAGAAAGFWYLTAREPAGPPDPEALLQAEQALLKAEAEVRDSLRAEMERGMAQALPRFEPQSAEGILAARASARPVPAKLPGKAIPQARFREPEPPGPGAAPLSSAPRVELDPELVLRLGIDLSAPPQLLGE